MAREAAQVIDQADQIVKDLTTQVLRMVGVSLQYSVITEDFTALQRQLEAAGFMVRVNDQFEKSYNFTLTYLRNWGEK